MAGSERCPSEAQRPALQPRPPEQHESVKRGIVIQLTGTEGEWDSLDDNELIFTLDKDGQKSLSSTSFLPKPRPCSMDIQTDDEWGPHSSMFHVPLSPSSPGSLGGCSSSSGLGFLSPTHRPLASLVKSLSTELELKDTSSLKPKPLLSLVKSISTELSRTEPEVSQSKSDSKLNLHLWTQLTQPKNRNGDSRTAPPSPVDLSPSEPKAGFFKAELEDTRRKLTEAMHEPLSVFSKIMREDSVGSPKHHKSTGSMDSLSSKGFGRSSGDHTMSYECPIRSGKRVECDGLPMCNWAVRHRKRCPQRSYLSHSHHSKPEDTEATPEVCTHGDDMLDGEITNKSGPEAEQPCSPVPKMALGCIVASSYCYFVLPLSPYWSGMFVGLALGFMLGLLLIRLGLTTAQPHTGHPYRLNENPYDRFQSETFQSNTHALKGWMNEMYAYDPETCCPSLMHSVYAMLDGSCLRLDYPRNSIPRWATFDELPHEKSFIHSRTFQLSGSKVFLLPPVLARKRVWNRKYPICITLAKAEEQTEEVGPETHPETHGAEKSAHLPSKPSHPTTLYLFGRTGREKEEWFHHLLSASTVKEEGHCETTSGRSIMICTTGVIIEDNDISMQVTGISSRGSTENISSVPVFPADLVGRMRENVLLDYTSYMTYLICSAHSSPLASSCHSSTQGSPTDKEQNVCYHGEETQPVWINALIGRIFWDFLHEKYWTDQVAHKIQRKLSKIRLPYFMDDLTLTELTMGSCMPQITSTSLPHINTRGLWLQLEIEYTGALQMTLETKINLSKLGKDSDTEAVREMETYHVHTRSKLSVLADSDEESSSAGSSDEEEAPSTEPQGTLGEKGTVPGAESGAAVGSTGRRILRFVDKIAKSKYFQKATENEYIKKKIEEMSNTPLLLTVKVQELSGTLAINIPPPPTDRIWYSFCVPPKLDLRVRPKLGEREVTFCHVTEWIEKKLQDEFQKVFVLPNMDDIYLPLMHSAMESQPAPQQNPTPHCSTINSSETCSLSHTSQSD
ncbi:testis-expressed protein 2 [Colossoma macropomum]|uniref:testis-expressed protein 2 n=1 Tax=Colossoma macropomum TaxID=42526 RepID=UPI001863E43D|nr:testis-expressed protein 2 [Colossoma macropomum]